MIIMGVMFNHVDMLEVWHCVQFGRSLRFGLGSETAKGVLDVYVACQDLSKVTDIGESPSSFEALRRT